MFSGGAADIQPTETTDEIGGEGDHATDWYSG
jgi:hypothetical protein